MASVAQFIERSLDESSLHATSDIISRDESRLGRHKCGPYEIWVCDN